MAALKRILMKVSDPQSPEYGRYLTRDQVQNLTSPPKSSIDEAENWLRTARFEHVRQYADALKASASAPIIEQVFNTTIHRSEVLIHGASCIHASPRPTIPHAIRQ